MYYVCAVGESESNSDSSDDDEMGSVEEIVEPREYLQQAMRGYRRGEGLHQMRAAYHNLRERSQQRQLQVVAAQRSISTSRWVYVYTSLLLRVSHYCLYMHTVVWSTSLRMVS